MDGDLYELSLLVSAARNSIQKGDGFIYLCNEHINSMNFRFMHHRTFFPAKSYEAGNPQEWFRYCMKKGVYDMKVLTPLQVPDRSLLGFANVNNSRIVTFYKNNMVTYWSSIWEVDNTQSKWNVKYQEYKWDNPPQEAPQFENNIREFKDILLRISEFANQIEAEFFGKIFRNAHDVLSGKCELPDKYSDGTQIRYPNISEEKKRIFHASAIADVFGAMGSWNDSPDYYAHAKGLGVDYEKLSDELLRQIRLATLYAINES